MSVMFSVVMRVTESQCQKCSQFSVVMRVTMSVMFSVVMRVTMSVMFSVVMSVTMLVTSIGHSCHESDGCGSWQVPI